MGFKNDLKAYTSLECEDKDEMLSLIQKSKDEGADIVELCFHCLSFDHLSEIEPLLLQRILPSIISFRPKSQKNVCTGDPNKKCLQVLKRAVELDVEVVDIDIEVASDVVITELMRTRSNTKIMVSSHVNGGRICREKLANLVINLQSIGADVIKLVIHVSYITDVAPLFHILTHCQVPLIIRAVGDRGLISQLLGPKYGASLVCGSLGENSIPGLPSLVSIREVYNLEHVNVDTKIYGVVSNPVGHSKGPLLHNRAFRHVGYNGIYVPLLVDNLKEFFRVYSCNDFVGFSVGIPHKEAAVQCCDEVHPLAKSIGAVNTIIRRPGKLIGYNTDCEACITAIDDALRGNVIFILVQVYLIISATEKLDLDLDLDQVRVESISLNSHSSDRREELRGPRLSMSQRLRPQPERGFARNSLHHKCITFEYYITKKWKVGRKWNS